MSELGLGNGSVGFVILDNSSSLVHKISPQEQFVGCYSFAWLNRTAVSQHLTAYRGPSALFYRVIPRGP